MNWFEIWKRIRSVFTWIYLFVYFYFYCASSSLSHFLFLLYFSFNFSFVLFTPLGLVSEHKRIDILRQIPTLTGWRLSEASGWGIKGFPGKKKSPKIFLLLFFVVALFCFFNFFVFLNFYRFFSIYRFRGGNPVWSSFTIWQK